MIDLTQMRALALKVANYLDVLNQSELAAYLRGCKNIRNYGSALNFVQQYREASKGRVEKPMANPSTEAEKANNKEIARQWCAHKHLKKTMFDAWACFKRIRAVEKRERRDNGFVSYKELRRIGNENGWVRWQTSGLMEKLSIGEDGRLYAESAITKKHGLPARVRWYRCVQVEEGGKAVVSINELTSQRQCLIDHGFAKLLRDLSF